MIEIVTVIPIVLFVDEGRHAPPREGRSWVQIGLGAWGTDILKERSYVWLLISRLFFLMAPSVLFFLGLFFLVRTLNIPIEDSGGPIFIITLVVGAVTGLATFPAAWLSDRIGRKRVIYLAIALGMIGMSAVAIAPSFPFMVVALIPVGISAGTFLAVDWALMTDIIPKATSGRYMGISNVATAVSGPAARLISGILLTVLVLIGLPGGAGSEAPADQSSLYEIAPRICMAVTLVFFAIAACCAAPRRRDAPRGLRVRPGNLHSSDRSDHRRADRANSRPGGSRLRSSHRPADARAAAVASC